MAENLPSITVVIAARPNQSEIKAVAAVRALQYRPALLELIVARGRQPSAQRNAALAAARGDWIYFLDDDSVPDPGNLERATRHLRAPEIRMVGGPNLCPPEAPPMEQVFALVLSSRLAFGPSRARYSCVGAARSSSEKELILCNLLTRRDAMLELGGFNEALYPNEENALMDELQKRGGKLIYDPSIFVYRRPRSSLKAFAKMLMTYGRGRAEQFRLHPTAGSLLNLVPPFFCVYLLTVVAALALMPALGKLLLLPLGVYAAALLVEGASLIKASGPGVTSCANETQRSAGTPGAFVRALRAGAATPLIFLTHMLYGAGFWRGLFTSLRPNERSRAEVVLEELKPLGSVDWKRPRLEQPRADHKPAQ